MDALRQLEHAVDLLMKLSPELVNAKKELASIADKERAFSMRETTLKQMEERAKQNLLASDAKLQAAQDRVTQMLAGAEKQVALYKEQSIEVSARNNAALTSGITDMRRTIDELANKKATLLDTVAQLELKVADIRATIRQMKHAAATIEQMTAEE